MLVTQPGSSILQHNDAATVLLYRKGPLRIAEMWFASVPLPRTVDIVRFFQLDQPLAGVPAEEFPTILIDLAPSPDALFAAAKKEARYEIRRAVEKDGLVVTRWRDQLPADVLHRFSMFYKDFARDRGLADETSRVQQLRAAGMLWLSAACDGAGETLSWHAYLCGRRRARLLHSCSLYRRADTARKALVGRANRFHHWQDMLAMRECGIQQYDFGGWYPGQGDEQRLRINRFKEEFGGSVVINFNAVQGLTPAGRSALRFHNLWRRLHPGQASTR